MTIINAIYYLQKIQLMLRHLYQDYKDTHILEKWIKEVDDCQMVFEQYQIEHPLLQKCISFITDKLILPFERQLEHLVHTHDPLKELANNMLDFNYVIKRISLVKLYIPDLVKVPLNDLFCKEHDDEEWIQLQKYVEFIDLDEPVALAKAFSKFDDYISIGCAYSKLGDKYNMMIIGALIQNIGGAYLMTNIKIAKEIKLNEITNPSLQFVQNLWSIQDKCGFIKKFMQMTMTKIKFNQKIYIPYLFKQTFTEEGILEEIQNDSLYSIQEFQGFHFNEEHLYEDIIQSLTIKNSKRIRVRLLSANQNIFKKKVNYDDIVHQIADLSKTHSNIQPEKVQLPNSSKIKKIVLQIHGGGWIAMSSFSHQTYTRKWANRLGEDALIFSIDYRLAPENPYPAAIEDIWQCYLWVLHFAKFYLNISDEIQIVLAGDSAGGNMALGICYRAIKENIRLPDGLLLCYPACNLNIKDFNPYLLNGIVDEIAPSTVLMIVLETYLKSEKLRPDIDPYLSPLYASKEFLRLLPKTYIMSGALDSLSGDCIKFVNNVQKAGKKDIKLFMFNGLSHGFMNFEVPVMAVAKIKPVIEKSCQLICELFK